MLTALFHGFDGILCRYALCDVLDVAYSMWLVTLRN